MSSKQVTFDEITIREYPMELGENPGCSSGAPVQLGWDHMSSHTRSVDLYEYIRDDRRDRSSLRLPVQRRAQILLSSGYSLEQIATAALNVAEIKKFRSESLKKQGWERASLLLENTGKLPKGLLNGMASLLVKPKQKTVQARTA